MNKHEQVREQLALAAVGALSREALVESRRHAAQCPECAADLASLELLAGALTASAAPPAPDALVMRTRALMLARLAEGEERERLAALGWTTALAWVAGLATVLLARLLWLGPAAALAWKLPAACGWLAGWMLFMWCTAGVAAAALARRRAKESGRQHVWVG